MLVKDFIEDFKAKKIVNSKVNEHAVEDYIKKTLRVKTYLPFNIKKDIINKIITANIKVVNGYKTVSSINQFLSFVTSMLIAYTDLEIEDPYEAYDMLSESKLLQSIIDCFRSEYDACDILLKLALKDEMQTNTTPAIIAQFLDEISEKLGDFSGILKEKLSKLDINSILGDINLSDENINLIKGILNK